jgi:hypothetical protein
MDLLAFEWSSSVLSDSYEEKEDSTLTLLTSGGEPDSARPSEAEVSFPSPAHRGDESVNDCPMRMRGPKASGRDCRRDRLTARIDLL